MLDFFFFVRYNRLIKRKEKQRHKKNTIEGMSIRKEGTDHQKSKDLPQTIRMKERYGPPKT